jgi:flagellar hook-associated protein 2
MAGISAYGAGGSSSVDQLVYQFIQQERRPINTLENDKSELRARLKIFTDLRSKLTTLQDRVKDYGSATELPALAALRASVSDESIMNAEVTTGASAGVTTVKTNRLATRDMAVSSKINNLDATTLAEQFDGTTQKIKVKVGGASEFQVVEIDFTDPAETNKDVMLRVRDTLNSAGIEITASIIKDSSTSSRLTVTSNETGFENKLVFKDKNGSSLLEELGFHAGDNTRRSTDGDTGGFVTKTASQLDASLVVNGIAVTSSSNTITDVIEGLSFDLLAEQDAEAGAITINVEQDSDTVKKEVEDFLKDYNEIIDYMNMQTSVDTTTFVRGPLAGDFTFINLRLNLRNAIVSPVDSAPSGSAFLLSELGISSDRSGKLSIKDSSKFNDALEENPQALMDMFTGENGIADRVENVLDRFVETGGLVDSSKKAVDRKIKNIDSRIDRYEGQLVMREAQLRRQFTDLQRTLAALQSQQYMMSQFSNSMAAQGF